MSKGKKYAKLLDELEEKYIRTRFFVLERNGDIRLLYDNKKIAWDEEKLSRITNICLKHFSSEEMDRLYLAYDWCDEIPENRNCVAIIER